MAAGHGNLADPEYEPSDEELRELVHGAFADVARHNQDALRKVHADIAEMRRVLMLRFVAPHPTDRNE